MRIIIILMFVFQMLNTSCLSRNREGAQTELDKIIDKELGDIEGTENIASEDFDPDLDSLTQEGQDPFAEFGQLGKADPVEDSEDIAANLKDLESFEDSMAQQENLQEPGEVGDFDVSLDVAQEQGDVSDVVSEEGMTPQESSAGVAQQEEQADVSDVVSEADTTESSAEVAQEEELEGTEDFIAPAPTVSSDMGEAAEQAFDTPRTQILGLDYRGSQNGGTIVVKANGPLNYATRSNDNGSQVIIDIPNTELPKKFQRPYITKDFAGPIGMFRAYQDAGSTTTRIIMQLKEPINPTIISEGNQLLVMALEQSLPIASGESEQSIVQNIPEQDGIETVPEIDQLPSSSGDSEDLASGEESSSVAVNEKEGSMDERALSDKTLDDFLTGKTSKFYGRPINIEFKDADIREIFNFIAEYSGLNLVLSDAVTGRLSLKLREIPWDQALVVVMQSKSLGYIRHGNILRIAPLSMIRQETQAMKSVVDAKKQLAPLFLKIFPISYAQAPTLLNQVSQFVTPNRGSIRADQRTNSLIVSDILENINRIGKLIRQLDTQTPQVLIEGKIVEARETVARTFGIDWSGGTSATATPGTVVGGQPGAGAGGTTPVAPSVSSLSSKVGDILNINVGQQGYNIGVRVGTISNGQALIAQLNLLESQDIINVLSSPRIMTLNNNQATITQETQVPILKSIATEGATQSSVEFKSISLNLSVTPQITIDGGIIMKVSVKREFPGASISLGQTSAAPINSRSADTTVLVNNGDTTVIGGIYESDVTKSDTGLPLLGRIPILGHLFKNTRYNKSKTELLIFLTPRVLNQERAFISSTEEQELEGDVTEDSDTL